MRGREVRHKRYRNSDLLCAIGEEDVRIFADCGACRLVFYDGPISEFTVWIDGIRRNVLDIHDGEYSLVRVMEEVLRILNEGDKSI